MVGTALRHPCNGLLLTVWTRTVEFAAQSAGATTAPVQKTYSPPEGALKDVPTPVNKKQTYMSGTRPERKFPEADPLSEKEKQNISAAKQNDRIL